MENQEEKETSVEFLDNKVLEVLEYHSCEHIDISDALHEAKKMYAEEIAKAYNDGCLKGYNDHVKLTNTLYK